MEWDYLVSRTSPSVRLPVCDILSAAKRHLESSRHSAMESFRRPCKANGSSAKKNCATGDVNKTSFYSLESEFGGKDLSV